VTAFRVIYWSYADPGNGVNNSAVARGRLVEGAAPKVENVEVISSRCASASATCGRGRRERSTS
jgi:aldose sugar dehydrogenase